MERMYRLLIVDDEYHIVDWLAELFEEQEELNLEIYRAYLAREALEILGRVKIDIVLSDIRMPGMDGFDLADKITAEWPKAKIIFLTGYNEFEYAYKANQYQNISFLLKTDDDDVIFGAIKNAVKLLEEETRQLEFMREYAGMQKAVEWQFEKNMLASWLEKGNPAQYSEGIEATFFPFDSAKKSSILCIRVEMTGKSMLEQAKLAAAMQGLLQEMLFGKGDIGLLDMDSTHFLAVVQTRTEIPIMVYLREMLDEFSVAILESLECHVFFTLYEEPVPFGQLREKYEVLKLAAQDVADTGNLYGGRIVGRKEEESLLADNAMLVEDHLLKEKLESMAELLEQGKKQSFFSVFEEIYQRILHVNSRHHYPAIEIFQYFSVMYLSLINRKNLVEKLAFQTALVKLMNLYDFKDWKEAFDYLRNLGELLFQEQEREQKSKNDAFLDAIKQFVQENLREDLSLTYIAQQLHYNPSYVSRLFKQLSGKNLSEYIMEEKMAYARKRLETCDDTIAAIALAVGFDSSQYFSVVFKKQTGMTPGEYRHRFR